MPRADVHKAEPWMPATDVRKDPAAARTRHEATHGRYGNAEVARVATLRDPALIDVRRAAVVTSKTGEEAAKGAGYREGTAGPKPDGKDKKPDGKDKGKDGAARVAGAETDEKKKKDKEKEKEKEKDGKKKEAAGKDKAATKGDGDAKEDAGEEKKKEGEAKEGGEEGAGEAAGVPGGGEAAAAGELPPPERPRLEGTQAVVATQPPLNAQQLERLRSQTGFTADEHCARVQVQLDRLSARATSEQFAIVVHIELLEQEVRRDLDNAAALIQPAVKGAIESVRGACGAARANIMAASDSALQTIETHATKADRAVDVAALTSKEGVEKAVLACSPKIRDLYEETMKPLRELLASTAEEFKQAGIDQGLAMLAEAEKIGGKLAANGGDPYQIAQDEKRAQAATDQAQVAKGDLEKAGEAAATEILGQEAAFGLSFLRLVNPVAVKVETIGAADAKTPEAKGGEVRLRLATDYERARGFVEETRKRALKALTAMEESAVKQLELTGRSLEEMARARRDQLCNGILEARGPAADAWAQEMARVNQLVPPGQIVDWRKLEPRFVEAMDSMNALSARQRLDFDAQARSGLDEARAAMDGDRRTIDETADSYVGSARETRAQATAIRQVAATFAEGFRGVAQPASSLVAEFRARTEEKLGLSVEDTRKQMGLLLAETRGSMKEAVKRFNKALGDQVKGLEARLAPTFQQVGLDVILNLADRAGRAFRAMDKVGTDETGLFDALHAMTPKYGRALQHYWNQADHAHDLWWWLDDELSGDEYWTAYYYLLGDPVKGAQYELSASIHWYGDDVSQMEGALRALTPEQLKEMQKDPAFAKVKAKLEGSLKGTNLEVVQALLAGRTARADALRLKEKIDAARAAGKDDQLHDLLAGINPKQLPEVRRELADVIAGHKMTDKKPELDDIEGITKYVTRPVKVYEPAGPAGGMRERIRTLSEPSKNLAVALIKSGEGSPDSRAARLVYETTRGGKPRPERLAKALDDPELVAARKDKIFTDPQADPKDLEAAKANLDRLEARRNEMLTKFAELRGADEATRKDPKRALEFTENAVGNMFGGDKLGRELGTSMVRDGRAKPAVAIKFAVRGWGTNEELIRKTLRGMSKEDIAELKTDYAARFGDGNANKLFDDLGVFQNADTARVAGVAHATGGGFFTELSGDDRHEVEELLLGTPENDLDRYRMARLKYQHQKGENVSWMEKALNPKAGEPEVAGLGPASEAGFFEGASGRSLDMNKARMEAMVAAAGGEEAAFDKKTGNFKDPTGRVSSNDFRMRTAATSEMAENYKHHIDSLCDLITGAIAIIGAIVGTIVVTVLTLGTATPLVIGLWAAGIAAATGAATMATKYALKGSRYGWEEAAVDGALTLVDAATAGLMAGAGAKAARATAQLAAVKAAARTPAQAATAARLAERHASKELARGFVRAAKGAGVSGTARTAMQDGTWDEGVLTGLGRSVAGGAKAAAIGVATHGANTAFSRSGLGQRLGQSTSYIARGKGAGLGGALGGMSGRATEVTLDALGGHQQGPWYEVMGSIALAGGRGFAENFGQGMAEVPKARRDAAQARLDAARGKADAERVARHGTSTADEAGDLRFRRLAAEAALAVDPRTNLKAFVGELDAAVASDRALAEAHRQLVRSYRREALAAIPPERRGEFADVPIHVLPDAEFERFTGSKSGRAVTIIVDGEPRIVVRKNSAPDVMREEGIHVLQSRDPRWRERIALLDERTMARWHELDLETQLFLYREKIEIEIDAQQRLRQQLIEEADRTPDPARRAALLARAEEAESTHASLRSRREEVDAIGPAQRERIRAGQEAKPQYLREPARLFAKPKPLELQPRKLPQRKTPLEHDSEDLDAQRRHPRDLANSTWEKDYPGHRLYQVGDVWEEWETYRTATGEVDRRKRWYRMVEVTTVIDGEEVVVDRRREILQLGRKGRWQQRGSETTERGSLFEETSRQRTLARIREKILEKRLAAGTRADLGEDLRVNRDEIVPIGALHRRGDKYRKPLSAQADGGAGFDDIVIEFRRVNGRLEAHIVVIEAKGYRRSLTLEDFSAITANMDANLARLGAAIAESNLSGPRRAAVARAIARRDLHFELHLSPTTGLGKIKSVGATIVRNVQRTEMARRHLAALTGHLERLDTDPLTPPARQQLTEDVARLARLDKRLKDAYAAEPFDPARIQRALAEILDARGDGSLRAIAERHGLALDERAVRVQRIKIDPEGKDAPHADAARLVRAKASPRTRAVLSVAEGLGLADKTFRPLPTAPTPADVTLARSARDERSLAIVRPSLEPPDSGGTSAAARQLSGLLRDGVQVPGGRTVHPDHVIWDALKATPAQVALLLEQVRSALASDGTDPSRLKVVLDGSLATDKTALLKLLSMSGRTSVNVERVTRTPGGSATWVLAFEPLWTSGPSRK